MIYKLNISTGEITVASSDEARSALCGRWSNWSINDMFRTAKVLTTATAAYCRFRDRLEDLHRDNSDARLSASLAVRGLSMREVRQ